MFLKCLGTRERGAEDEQIAWLPLLTHKCGSGCDHPVTAGHRLTTSILTDQT